MYHLVIYCHYYLSFPLAPSIFCLGATVGCLMVKASPYALSAPRFPMPWLLCWWPNRTSPQQPSPMHWDQTCRMSSWPWHYLGFLFGHLWGNVWGMLPPPPNKTFPKELFTTHNPAGGLNKVVFAWGETWQPGWARRILYAQFSRAPGKSRRVLKGLVYKKQGFWRITRS